VRVAVIQAMPVDGLYSKKNLSRALELLDKLPDQGIDIAVFPDGYPSTGEDEIRKKTAEIGVHVVASVTQKIAPRKYYDESIVIDPNGEIVGRHRKAVLLWMFEPELIEPGDAMEVFSISLGNIGILKCSETLYPEPASILAQKGADIILVQANFPTNILHHWHRILMTRAWENWIPIAAANNAVWVKEGVVFKEVDLTTVYGGKSLIIVPECIGESMEDLPLISFSRGDFFAERRMIKAMAGHGEEVIIEDINLDFYRNLRRDFLRYRMDALKLGEERVP